MCSCTSWCQCYSQGYAKALEDEQRRRWELERQKQFQRELLLSQRTFVFKFNGGLCFRERCRLSGFCSCP